ncbi:MAG: hypothetical protein ACLUO4_07740 [Christensenellales bacterium]
MTAWRRCFSVTLNNTVKHQKTDICLYWQEKQEPWAEEIRQSLYEIEDVVYTAHGNTMCLQCALTQKQLQQLTNRWAAAFVRTEQPRLLLQLVQKQLPELNEKEQAFVAAFAGALAKQQGMHDGAEVYLRRLGHRLRVCLAEGPLHLGGFEDFRLADVFRRWERCVRRVVSMAVLRYDWTQQLDAWRSLVEHTESACALVRIRSADDRFILQIKGAKKRCAAALRADGRASAAQLLARAPEKIEIVLGPNGRPSWIYEVIEQVFWRARLSAGRKIGQFAPGML